MALRTDRVPFFGSELRGIHNGGLAGIADMLTARAMTALASDAVIKKWRIGIPVLVAIDWAQPGCVARETGRIDGPIEPHLTLLLVTGRRVPDAFLLVPGYRQLIKKPLSRGDIAAPGCVR